MLIKPHYKIKCLKLINLATIAIISSTTIEKTFNKIALQTLQLILYKVVMSLSIILVKIIVRIWAMALFIPISRIILRIASTIKIIPTKATFIKTWPTINYQITICLILIWISPAWCHKMVIMNFGATIDRRYVKRFRIKMEWMTKCSIYLQQWRFNLHLNSKCTK